MNFVSSSALDSEDELGQTLVEAVPPTGFGRQPPASERASPMSIEWNFLRGPLASVGPDVVRNVRDHVRHRTTVRVGISSNPLVSFVRHEGALDATRSDRREERMVCVYETGRLDEAIEARDLLLACIREDRPFPPVEADDENSILDEDSDLPYFVYVLSDSSFVFSGGSRFPA